MPTKGYAFMYCSQTHKYPDLMSYIGCREVGQSASLEVIQNNLCHTVNVWFTTLHNTNMVYYKYCNVEDPVRHCTLTTLETSQGH